MAYKDLHIDPFDNGTIAKLEIFEDYAQAWIPTFVMQSEPVIHIFDFFSGPGYDHNLVPGSPIRILQKVKDHLGNILQSKTKIVLHFNEFEPSKKAQEKYELLKLNCNKFIDENPKFKYFLEINFYNKNAEQLFFELLPLIKKYPSLVYLDQNGVKFISKEYINELEIARTTDFLYFVSSSYFKWLGGTPEFKKVIDFDKDELEKEEYKNIHRLVLTKIKSMLKSTSPLKLFPFSIKKGTNLYGIVFGSKSYAAVDKFLSIAWKRNEINGEADFDIDGDLQKIQLDIWHGKKMTKIERFQDELSLWIKTGQIKTNKDALLFTYENGHIPQHAVETIKGLKRSKIIDYDARTPMLNYDNVFRKRNVLTYKLIH